MLVPRIPSPKNNSQPPLISFYLIFFIIIFFFSVRIEYDKENEFSGLSVSKDGDCPQSISKTEIQEASNELVKKIVRLTQSLPRLTGSFFIFFFCITKLKLDAGECRCSLHLHCRKGGMGEYSPTGFSLLEDIGPEPPFTNPMGKIKTQYHELDVCAKLPIDLFGEVESQEETESSLLSNPHTPNPTTVRFRPQVVSNQSLLIYFTSRENHWKKPT